MSQWLDTYRDAGGGREKDNQITPEMAITREFMMTELSKLKPD